MEDNERGEGERAGSKTVDEEEDNFQVLKNLVEELQVHPYDTQDLNLYPINFQDSSQTYANLLC